MRQEISVWFKRGAVASLCLGLAGLWLGCPKKSKVPVLLGGAGSDFNVSLDNFLYALPVEERKPLIHALLFLATGEMDSAYYQGKTAQDLQNFPLTQVLKFELNGKTSAGIRALAQRRFLQKGKDLNRELSEVHSKLSEIRQKLAAQELQAEMLDGFLVQGFKVRYEKAPFKVLVYLNFRVDNQTAAKVRGFTFRVQFLDKAGGTVGVTEEKIQTFEEPLAPGSTRDFSLLASNCPVLPGAKASEYAARLQATVQVTNASLDGGKLLLTTIPDFRLAKDADELTARQTILLRIMEISKDRGDFSFWSRSGVAHGKNLQNEGS